MYLLVICVSLWINFIIFEYYTNSSWEGKSLPIKQTNKKTTWVFEDVGCIYYGLNGLLVKKLETELEKWAGQ